MKNIFYSLLACIVLLTGFSCKDNGFLDETVITDLDYDRVFIDSALTEGFLIEIYRQIGFDTKANRFSRDGENLGGLQTASDEAEYKMSSKVTADVQFATGTVNPVVITDDAWKTPYENIRRVNIFFKGIENTPIQPALKQRLKAEARFLRAWYYSILLRHYGGVPIIGDTIYQEKDQMKGKRDTYDACVQYIVNECKLAEKDLAIRPSGRLYGRASGGACKALIARLKLYAASPLFNGNSDIVSGSNCPAELLGYPEYNAERWKDAMDAAMEVIRLGQYKLFELHTDPLKNNEPDPGHGFYAQFIAADTRYASSKPFVEAILEDRSESNRARESWFQPPSRSGSGGGYIYQELVDAFPMNNGLPIDNPESGYDPQNPYKDRDPRLRNTVVYDGVYLQSQAGTPTPISIALNTDGTASDKDAVHQGTPTGYYINKMVNRDLAANSIHSGAQQTPIIRYAEVLIMYAEAMNEYLMTTQGEGAIVSANEETYQILKQIRKRGGININDDPANPNHLFGLKPNMTRLEMRKAIQDEKRIEFAIEGHRFWDVRRWKIADETDNQQMTGLEPRKTADGGRSYKSFDVRKRIFRKAMYFWPIPYKETIKLPELIQNPNYNL